MRCLTSLVVIVLVFLVYQACKPKVFVGVVKSKNVTEDRFTQRDKFGVRPGYVHWENYTVELADGRMVNFLSRRYLGFSIGSRYKITTPALAFTEPYGIEEYSWEEGK